MSNNALKTIKSDLFVHNKNLQVIDFEANDIENVGIAIFLNLKNLTWINLRDNLKFDYAAESRKDVEEYLKYFKENYADFVIHDAIECTYGFTTISYIGNLYYCDVVHPYLELEFHFAFGEHQKGKNDDDVNAFVLKNSNITTFPVDLQNTFTNLQGIEFTNSPLSEIPVNSFHNLTNLISIDLSNNQIREIHPGTFKNNNKLILMNFSKNKLIFIASDILDDKNLKKVDFSDNTCIDETAIDLEIQYLKEEFEENCQNEAKI